MYGDLYVHLISYGQAIVDRGRCRTPVFVQFQANDAGSHLFAQGQTQAGVTLSQQAEIHRKRIQRLQHASDMPGPRSARGCRRTRCRSCSAAYHGGNPRHQRLFDLLRADQMDVAVNASGGDDRAFACDDFGRRTDDDGDVGLDVRIAGFADTGNATILDADIRLDDAQIVDDKSVGNDGVGDFMRAALALAHAIADNLAAAELHLFPIDGEV